MIENGLTCCKKAWHGNLKAFTLNLDDHCISEENGDSSESDESENDDAFESSSSPHDDDVR